MSYLLKSSSSTNPSFSVELNLPLTPVLTTQRRNVEIPKRTISTSSPIQYQGGITQEILVMVLNNEIISMLTKIGRHINKQNETNKMLFERMESMSLDSGKPMETTSTPYSFLQPMILNIKACASSEHQARDFILRQTIIFINSVNPSI